MSFVMVGVVGAGIVISAIGQAKANEAQADAEEANAAYYREQAQYAKEKGERDRMIFDRESVVLNGEQLSAFAKAGVDTSASSLFMAQQLLYRSQESFAIQKEANQNVRLANLRAGQSQQTADDIRDSTGLQIAGSALGKIGSVL